MKAIVQFTVDISFNNGLPDEWQLINEKSKQQIKDAVAEAVTNALAYAQDEGHKHSMANEISILTDSHVMVTI